MTGVDLSSMWSVRLLLGSAINGLVAAAVAVVRSGEDRDDVTVLARRSAEVAGVGAAHGAATQESTVRCEA